MKYVGLTALTQLISLIKTALATKSNTSHTHSAATTSANGFMSAADKTKLDGISGTGSYSLPTATASVLGGVKVGSNLSINNGVLSATNTTYGAATTSANGLMAAADKVKLNGISTGANTVKSTATATLTVAGWTGSEAPFTQTVNVSGVTASNIVIISPAPADAADYGAAGCTCSAQGSGTLTFECAAKPDGALAVNVLKLN